MSVDQSCVILEAPVESEVLSSAQSPTAQSRTTGRKSQVKHMSSSAVVVVVNTEPEGVVMTTSPARPRPLPPAEAVQRPEPIRTKPSAKPTAAPPRAGTKPPKQDAKIL